MVDEGKTKEGLTAELRRATQQIEDLALALANTYDAVVITDMHGQLRFANRAAEALYQYGPGEMSGESVCDLYSDSPSTLTALEIFEATVSTGTWEGEAQGLRNTGEKFPIRLRTVVMRDEQGKPVGVVEISTDMTERRPAIKALGESIPLLDEAMAELRRKHQQVAQEERLRALGQMASGVAHDFSNALMPILTFTEFLLEDPSALEDRGKSIEYLNLIRTTAMDAANMAARLRSFSREQEDADASAPVNLNNLVMQTISLTQAIWQQQVQVRGVTIGVETQLRSVGQLWGNEGELREMLINLLLNSADAMPDGGTITIRTRRDSDYAVLKVQDTGMGMSEEVRHHCLEPFFTTKGPQGMGLGLALVHGIVLRHEGTIDIESREGEGTIFTIRLPIKEPRRGS